MSVSRLNSWLSSHRSINQFWLLIINWLLIIDPSDVINQFLKRLFINQTKPFRRGGKWDTSGCFSVFYLSLIRVPHGELAAGWGADLHAYTHAHAAGARHGRAILWLEAVERGRWEGFGRLGLLAGKKLQSPSALLPVQGLGLVLLRGQVLVEKPPQGTVPPGAWVWSRCWFLRAPQESTSPWVCAKPRVLLPERGRAYFLHPRCLVPQSLSWPQPEAQPWFLSTVL